MCMVGAFISQEDVLIAFLIVDCVKQKNDALIHVI